jgi:ubiquinone/menaquinone biosynthesis C-methylase UbiE
MEKLLAFLPERAGNVLDVACGLGATTRYLTRYYAPARVVGVNFSASQVAVCRANAPDCYFCLADATRLSFADQVFDTVICVEAAIHFASRAQFFREAWRVLQPSGSLLLTDLILQWPNRQGTWMFPSANQVQTLAEYHMGLRQAGFQNIELVDARHECWETYCRRLGQWALGKFARRAIEADAFHHLISMVRDLMNAPVKHYVLAAAHKV